jgi:transcriptional regulator with XRE-family HTH domain
VSATTETDLQELRDRIRLAPLPLIAARLRRARRAKGYSHDQLGELMGGVTRQHLIKLEKAKHRPGPEMLVRASDALELPLDYFLLEAAGEPNPFPDEQAA